MSDFAQDDILKTYIEHKELAREGVVEPPSLGAYMKMDSFKSFLLHPILEPLHDLVRKGRVCLVDGGGVQIAWRFRFGDAERYLEVEFTPNGKAIYMQRDFTGACYGNSCACGTGYTALWYLWSLLNDVRDRERRMEHAKAHGSHAEQINNND